MNLFCLYTSTVYSKGIARRIHFQLTGSCCLVWRRGILKVWSRTSNPVDCHGLRGNRVPQRQNVRLSIKNDPAEGWDRNGIRSVVNFLRNMEHDGRIVENSFFSFKVRFCHVTSLMICGILHWFLQHILHASNSQEDPSWYALLSPMSRSMQKEDALTIHHIRLMRIKHNFMRFECITKFVNHLFASRPWNGSFTLWVAL